MCLHIMILFLDNEHEVISRSIDNSKHGRWKKIDCIHFNWGMPFALVCRPQHCLAFCVYQLPVEFSDMLQWIADFIGLCKITFGLDWSLFELLSSTFLHHGTSIFYDIYKSNTVYAGYLKTSDFSISTV